MVPKLVDESAVVKVVMMAVVMAETLVGESADDWADDLAEKLALFEADGLVGKLDSLMAVEMEFLSVILMVGKMAS